MSKKASPRLTCGEPLKAWMQKNGFSVKKMASMMGVSPGSIYAFLQGRITPRPDMMHRIWIATSGQLRPADFYSFGKEVMKCE